MTTNEFDDFFSGFNVFTGLNQSDDTLTSDGLYEESLSRYYENIISSFATNEKHQLKPRLRRDWWNVL